MTSPIPRNRFAPRTPSRGLVRLLLGNGLILLVILWAANTVASCSLDLLPSLKRARPDPRAALPNYAGRRAGAEVIFHEFAALESRYAPYVGWSRREFSGASTTVGADGDRIHRATTTAPVATLRIFGGSTVWGTGVDDQHTLPARFNERFPGTRVLNHGESGFLSRQSLARLVNLTSVGAEADLVIFYGGYNHVVHHCGFGVPLGGHSQEKIFASDLAQSSRLVDTLVGSTRALLSQLRNSPGTVHAPPFGAPLVGATYCSDDPTLRRRVVDALLRQWRIARAVSELAGARFIGVLQPIAALGAPRLDHLEIDASQAAELARVYRELRVEIAAAAEEWLIDLTSLMDGDTYYYIDGAHVDRAGNARLADAIATAIDDLGYSGTGWR